MKRIVVYTSKTGFTKQYANWIAEALSCEAKELKNVTEQELGDYDQVIYGGSMMAGMIQNYDKLAKMSLNQLVVFGVGMSEDTPEMCATIKEQNHLDNTPFYYFQGGVNYEKLGFFSRFLLKKITKQPTSVDYSKREYISSLISDLG